MVGDKSIKHIGSSMEREERDTCFKKYSGGPVRCCFPLRREGVQKYK